MTNYLIIKMLWLIFGQHITQYHYSFSNCKAMFHDDVLKTVNHNFRAPKKVQYRKIVGWSVAPYWPNIIGAMEWCDICIYSEMRADQCTQWLWAELTFPPSPLWELFYLDVHHLHLACVLKTWGTTLTSICRLYDCNTYWGCDLSQ